MIACSGCGLPRAEDQVGTVPCPVCAAAPEMPAGATAEASPPEAVEVAADPIAGLPADVSQMEERLSTRASPRWIIVGAFLLGTAVGVGGLFAAQELWHSGSAGPVSETSVSPASEIPIGSFPSAGLSAVAPMPRERPATGSASPVPPESARPEPVLAAQPEADPRPALDAPTLARRAVIDLNQPDAAYTVPGNLRKGEQIILRGKVRILRIHDLRFGAEVDASGLDAGSVYIGGKIDGGSVLRVRSRDGVVDVPAAVGGQSHVEIDAPGGIVRFVHPTTDSKPGSAINGGSIVAITARMIDLRGDVAGTGTKVSATLTPNGSLKAAAVRGTAVLEYRRANPQEPAPAASAAVVDPNATFRKVD